MVSEAKNWRCFM